MAVDEKKRDRQAGTCRKGEATKQSVKEVERWKFPNNITVDELYLYRKKRPNISFSRDNLRVEEGSFKLLKSEYRRSYKNFYATLQPFDGNQPAVFFDLPTKPVPSLKLEGVHDFETEYNESFNRHSLERLSRPVQRIIGIQNMETGTATTEVPAIEDSVPLGRKRRRLNKIPTTLKLEGDYYHLTEHAERFIEYLLAQRAQLLRTPTHLRLEGDMETKTENRDKYIRYDRVERPKLCKKFSELHLEGDLDVMTEKQEKFVSYEHPERPPLVKKTTNLQLEGDLNFTPEYKREFINYEHIDRPKLALPHNNLKPGDLFEDDSNELKLFDSKFHPLIPNLRDSDTKRDTDGRKTPRTPSRRESQKAIQPRESAGLPSRAISHPNLTITRASNSTLGGEAHPLDLGASFESLPRRSRSRPNELNYMRGDGKIEGQPEYSSAFVDFPRQRPRVRRPEGQISSEGEMDYMTEKRDKYHPHRFIERSESCKRDPELKLEGRFECQPEYRKAYIDYLIREKKPPVAQRRRAYDMLDGTDHAEQTSSDNINSTDTADNPKSTSPDEPPKSKPPPIFPADTSSSSLSSSPRPGQKGRRPSDRKLSEIEECAFGPKASSARRSLSPSPARGRRGSRGRRPSRDVSPRGRGSPRGRDSPSSRGSPRGRGNWSGINGTRSKSREPKVESKVGRDTAFLVLDKPESKKHIRNTLYKEQKWMPSWNYSMQ